ncbi:MAG: DUF2336 domain-containing protein, partial [Pseudomonadota bacterium]
MSELFAERFLLRLQAGTAAERAEIVRYLGRIYAETPAGSELQSDLSIALVAVLDDPVPMVRQSLSEATARCSHLPMTVLLGLAEDSPEVAAPLLRQNPSLTEAWLIDLVGSGREGHRLAIAEREQLGIGLTAAIAAIADSETCKSLLRNSGARISTSALATMIERFGDNPDLRAILLRRQDLPTGLRRRLIGSLTDSLARHVVSNNLMPANRASLVIADAEERALIEVGEEAEESELLDFAAQLHDDGAITVSMLLRALIDGRVEFVEAAFAVMANIPPRRVRAVLRRAGPAFLSLYRRCGLDPAGQGALAAAIDVLSEDKCWDGGPDHNRRRILERVLSRYEHVCGP